MNKDYRVLVIGGGIAGLTAALDLALLGVDVLLVEKGPFIGGHAANLTCKATDRCLKCNDCLVEERLQEVSQKKTFDILLRTEVVNMKNKGETFEVSLRSGPKWIDPHRCTGCGLCLEKCPEAAQDAILCAPSHHIHPFYAINPDKWSTLQAGGEKLCQEVCPEDAINLDEKETVLEIEVDGLVLATGYRPFDPAGIHRFNFHRFKNMVTVMDLEKMLRFKGEILRYPNDTPPESLAFIQCVGSRDEHLGHDYCSRVCCGYALRMALKLVHTHPDMNITFFYMDVQNVCRDFDRFLDEAKSRIRFIRGLPGDFYAAENDRVSIGYYDQENHKTVNEDFDMVSLSVGLTPLPFHAFLKDQPGPSLNEDGFLTMPEGSHHNGMVIAGSAEGPMDVSESISHAKRAAYQMALFLGVFQQAVEKVPEDDE